MIMHGLLELQSRYSYSNECYSVCSNGGKGGTSSGGGGGGGRLAVQAQSFNSFTGTLQAIGGTSTTPGSCGAAGTVYVKRSDTGVTRHTVTANNQAQDCDGAYTYVKWSDVTVPLFLDVRGKAVVKFDAPTSSNQPLVISHLDGDRTGAIVLQDQQVDQLLRLFVYISLKATWSLKFKVRIDDKKS
jgi:hypothetical protein